MSWPKPSPNAGSSSARSAGCASTGRVAGAQVTLAAFAIITSGWAIAVIIGLVFAGPAQRPRETGVVVAVELQPAPKPPATAAHRGVSASHESRKVQIEAPPGPALDDPPDHVATTDETGGDDFEPAVEALAEDLAGDAVAEDLAAGASTDDAHNLAEAARGCGREQGRGGPVEGEAVLDRLRGQLAAVSERVFALATRGLGASPPAEDAGSGGSLDGDGEAAALAQVASLERHVDRLATGVSALRTAESELLREFRPQLAYFIATAERVIERAGLDLDDVFQERSRPRRTAEGGPFIAAVSGPMAAERAALQSDLAYWQALRALVRRMPLAAPLDRYAISSSYGTRRDPINSRQAMHHGVDLISAANAPIRSPAPGIVVFAGRNGGYGNMVEIDHGRSLRTRYAHLKTIKVKAGEKVAFQQKLGTLGNSGRSTGAHLHYEILIAGKPADPLNFIKAGQHVFQD